MDRLPQHLIDEYKQKDAELETLAKKVRKMSYELVKKAVKAGDIDRAWELARECPCFVGKAFCFDYIRETTKCNYNGEKYDKKCPWKPEFRAEMEGKSND